MGERKGAKSAALYKKRSKQAEMRPAGRRKRDRNKSAAISNSGIGPGKSEVGNKISNDEKGATDDDRAENDKLIFSDEGFVDETAEAGIVHDIFNKQ